MFLHIVHLTAKNIYKQISESSNKVQESISWVTNT